MSKAPKPLALVKKHLTKDEIAEREAVEERYKLNDDLVYFPPDDLEAEERELYLFIVNTLRPAEILCNLDIEIIRQTVNAVIRMNEAEKHIKKYGQVIEQPDGKLVKNPSVGIYNDFHKVYQSNSAKLGLSVSDRAKLSILDLKKKEEKSDPLLQLRKG